MKHADRFAERILFLDGLPNFQALGRLRIGENVEEILKADLEAEMEAVKMYTRRRRLLREASTTTSAATSSPMSSRPRKHHVDMLETQFEMIARMGIQNYVQLQSEAASERTRSGRSSGCSPCGRSRARAHGCTSGLVALSNSSIV